MPVLSSPIRRVTTILLGLALLAALWTTALGRLSTEGSAVPMLASAGSELLNPLLTANGNGVAQSAWTTIQQQAVAHPDQVVSLPGIKVGVLGREIAGKSFADGTKVIYTQVAQAWYAHGLSFAFNLPAPLQQAVSTYDPFVSKSLNVPGLPKVSLPQIPGFLSPLVTHLGLSPTTLTASGHSDLLNLSRWLWIFSALLALALAIFSTGWHRLSNPAWALFHASWHIALLSILAWFLINHNQAATKNYMGVVTPLGQAFFPVYVTAALIGLAGVVGSGVAKRAIKMGAGIGRLASRGGEAAAVAPRGKPPMQQSYQPDLPARRGYGNQADYPVQSPNFGGQGGGQGWQQPQRSSYDDMALGGQGYGQSQQPGSQRPSFSDQAGLQPTQPMWDLPNTPPVVAPQQPPSAFPGSPDYAPRPRGANGDPVYPPAPSQTDRGGQGYGQPQPRGWPPEPDRNSGGW